MKIILILFSFLCYTAPTHDAAIAMFKIYEVEGKTQLYVSIDAEDLSSELGVSFSEVNREKLELYFTKNFSVAVDNERVTYTIDKFSFEMDHVKAIGSFENMPKKIQIIEIKNTCLIDVEDHSNIIQIDLVGETKDFRMHKGRSKIFVEY